MSEITKRKCNFCHEEHDLILKGVREIKNKGQAATTRKLYNDESGREWRGRRCPNCAFGKIVDKTCKHCSKSFKSNIKDGQIFCTIACKIEWHNNN